MPVFDYACDSCGGRFEEIVLCGDPTEDQLPCEFCDGKANRITIYAFSAPGLEDHQLESVEKQLFTKKQRAAGHKLRQSDNPLLRKRGEELRFKTSSALKRYEESKGWRRLEPGTTEYKNRMQDHLDDHSDITEAHRRGGKDAAADLIQKKSITEETGWGDAQYSRWKSMRDQVDKTTTVEVIDG